ncbi:MAG: hypothetical protein ABGY24_05710 [bacterium]
MTGAVGQEFLRVRAGMTTQDRCRLPMSSSPPPTRPSRAVSLVITPSQHHHNTITTPSQHHHNTITTPSPSLQHHHIVAVGAQRAGFPVL